MAVLFFWRTFKGLRLTVSGSLNPPSCSLFSGDSETLYTSPCLLSRSMRCRFPACEGRNLVGFFSLFLPPAVSLELGAIVTGAGLDGGEDEGSTASWPRFGMRTELSRPAPTSAEWLGGCGLGGRGVDSQAANSSNSCCEAGSPSMSKGAGCGDSLAASAAIVS